MSAPILVVGAGPSGLAAARALATLGQRVVLVDKADRLGGAPILSGYAKLVPSGEWARDAIGSMVAPVESSPHVEIHRETQVESFEDGPQAFTARLGNGESRQVSAAILCTGFTHFDPVNKPEWGFGLHPDVVTTTQIEQMISTGAGVRCPSDGRTPQARRHPALRRARGHPRRHRRGLPQRRRAWVEGRRAWPPPPPPCRAGGGRERLQRAACRAGQS